MWVYCVSLQVSEDIIRTLPQGEMQVYSKKRVSVQSDDVNSLKSMQVPVETIRPLWMINQIYRLATRLDVHRWWVDILPLKLLSVTPLLQSTAGLSISLKFSQRLLRRVGGKGSLPSLHSADSLTTFECYRHEKIDSRIGLWQRVQHRIEIPSSIEPDGGLRQTTVNRSELSWNHRCPSFSTRDRDSLNWRNWSGVHLIKRTCRHLYIHITGNDPSRMMWLQLPIGKATNIVVASSKS